MVDLIFGSHGPGVRKIRDMMAPDFVDPLQFAVVRFANKRQPIYPFHIGGESWI